MEAGPDACRKACCNDENCEARFWHPKGKCIANFKAIPIGSCMMRTFGTSLHKPQQHSLPSGLAIQCVVCLLPGQERRLHQRYGAWFASHASHGSVLKITLLFARARLQFPPVPWCHGKAGDHFHPINASESICIDSGMVLTRRWIFQQQLYILYDYPSVWKFGLRILSQPGALASACVVRLWLQVL